MTPSARERAEFLLAQDPSDLTDAEYDEWAECWAERYMDQYGSPPASPRCC